MARIGPYISQHVPETYLPPPPLPVLDWADAVAALWVILLGLFITQQVLSTGFNHQQRKWLWVGFCLKCVGCLFLTALYYFHYSGGDMFRFHAHIDLLEDGFSLGWSVGWRLFFREAYIDVQDFIEFEPKNPYFKFSDLVEDSGSYSVIRWAYVLSFVCTKSIWALNMAFGLLAFWGSLLICRILTQLLPNGFKVFVISLFLLPTSWIWANGMIKEALMMAMLGGTIWGIHHLNATIDSIKSRQQNGLIIGFRLLGYGLVIGLCLAHLYVIKPYFAVALLPFVSIWMISQWIHSQQKALPALFKAHWGMFYWAILLFVAVGLFVLLQNSPYRLSAALNHAEANRQWSFVVGGLPNATNSGYDLAPQFNSWRNGLWSGFKAVIYGLYLPLEADFYFKRNPLVWFFIFESAFLVILSFYLLARINFWRVLNAFQQHPILFWLIGFSFCYALWLGLSVPFFGSLVRYRVMVVPFWMIGLWILNQITRLSSIQKPIQ